MPQEAVGNVQGEDDNVTMEADWSDSFTKQRKPRTVGSWNRQRRKTDLRDFRHRGVQPLGVSGPHWKKKSCLGPHIK